MSRKTDIHICCNAGTLKGPKYVHYCKKPTANKGEWHILSQTTMPRLTLGMVSGQASWEFVLVWNGYFRLYE